MMRPFAILVAVCTCAFSAPPPSPALLAALGAVRTIDSDPAAWAAQAPEVAALAPADRDALVYWLDAHGRGPLHAQGATDAQIGVPYYPVDYAIAPAPWPSTVPPLPAQPPLPKPTPAPAQHHRSFWSLVAAAALPTVIAPVEHSSSSSTSTSPDGSTTTTTSSGTDVSVGVNTGALVSSLIDASTAHGSAQSPSSEWRQVPFGATTLDAADSPAHIAVTHGIASVRYDGTQGFACLSFVNNATQPVTEVDIDIDVLDGFGFLKRTLPLRRTGTFAPGTAVEGPTSLRDVRSAQPNCVIDGDGSIADPTDPFAGAFAIGYAIRRVTYADGTAWNEPGANPWPQAAGTS
jgi:hypothetical protein